MSDHPTRDALERYRRGSLAVKELLMVDDHVAACPECQAVLALDPGAALRHVEEGLGGEHPSYELLEQYVDGRMTEVDRESIEIHLGVCPACDDEARDLRSFRSRYSSRRRGVLLAGSLAAAATIAIVAGVLLRREDPRPPTPPTIARPVPAPPARPPQPTIPAEWRRTYDQLLAGVVPSAALVRDLRGDIERTRGTASPPEQHVLEPIGVIEPARPTFRFTATEGAIYRVEVFDPSFTRVAASPDLTQPSWTPTRPLPRGTVYSWQVVITSGSTRTTIPAPPAPPARFKVLDARSLAALEDARRRGDHLVAALICAETGLIEEALKEVELAKGEADKDSQLETIREVLERHP